jgi:hypothetical protein
MIDFFRRASKGQIIGYMGKDNLAHFPEREEAFAKLCF